LRGRTLKGAKPLELPAQQLSNLQSFYPAEDSEEEISTLGNSPSFRPHLALLTFL
jgi:hypothetical protein